MAVILTAWCYRRAFQPLRVVLPHYPMSDGFTDELTEFALALKAVPARMGATLPTEEFDRLVSLLHMAEDALGQHDRRV